MYNLKTAKGVFIKRNKILENLLERKGYNIDSVWDQILKDQGSILGLPDYILSPEEKEIFLTFKEINQLEIVKQKTTSKNPRSIVATVTEIYDYMRVLYARVGTPYSPFTVNLS